MGRTRGRYDFSPAEATTWGRPAAGKGEVVCDIAPLDRPTVSVVVKVRRRRRHRHRVCVCVCLCV